MVILCDQFCVCVMHVKWNRNLDGVRRPSSPFGQEKKPKDTESTLLLDPAHVNPLDDNNNNSKHSDRNLTDGGGGGTRKHPKRDHPHHFDYLQTPSTIMFPVTVSSNRITSKGALSTLIGLFRFHGAEELRHGKNRSTYRRRRLSLERICSSSTSSPSDNNGTSGGTNRSPRRRAHSLLVLQQPEVKSNSISSSGTKSTSSSLESSDGGNGEIVFDIVPKKVLVKFIDDEPTCADVIDAVMMASAAGENGDDGNKTTTTRQLQGILRVRNDSADIVSYRSTSSNSTSSSSSTSSTSSSKKVHFAIPIHTCSVFDGT